MNKKIIMIDDYPAIILEVIIQDHLILFDIYKVFYNGEIKYVEIGFKNFKILNPFQMKQRLDLLTAMNGEEYYRYNF